MGLCLGAGCCLGHAALLLSRPAVPVEDRSCREALAEGLKTDAQRLTSGAVEVMRTTDPANGLVVFLEGTEIGRLDGGQTQNLMERYPELESALSGSATAGGNSESENASSPLAGLFEDGAWKRFGHWEEKAAINYGLDYLYSGVLVRRNRLDVSMLKKVMDVLYLGAEASYLAFEGELPDSVPYAGKAGKFGWGISLGMDFLKYRLRSSPFALPDYFWTERNLDRKYFARNSPGGVTKVVKIFEMNAPPGLEHNIQVKAGVLRYELTLAPDTYRSALHLVALDDLPGVLGTWGMGVLRTPDGFIPGGWYRFSAIGLANIPLGEDSYPLRFSPGRITYFRAYRNQFRIAWNGELTFGLN